MVLFGLAMLAAGAVALPAPVIDNERVTVWDITLAPGQSGPPTPRDRDAVILFVEGGTVRTTPSAGPATTAVRTFGEAVFIPRGTQSVDTLVSGGPAHEVMVALKDNPVPLVPNTTGLPAAFPRPGSVKVLENPGVVVWNYSWSPGVRTPMHFHDKDVVLSYRYDGALKSATPDGAETVNAYKAGEIRFNRANRAHAEELTSGRQSAVMMELK